MRLILLLPLLLLSTVSVSQIDTIGLKKEYNDYTRLYREKVYVHLNKTTYIEGESIGFSAYVFDKGTKSLSPISSNLYCEILDKDDHVVSQKLILLNQGIGNGQFSTDSIDGSGQYKFRAYTNWMRNFPNEYNHYTQNILVKKDSNVEPETSSNEIDVQALPESGHLILNLNNTIGVIAKDKFGRGVSYLKMNLEDDSGNVLQTITLNEFGIGAFSLLPKTGISYQIAYTINTIKKAVKIEKVKQDGVLMSLKRSNKQAILKIETNNTTRVDKLGEYKLLIHNGLESKILSFSLDESQNQLYRFSYENLYKGINIFTLFNSEKKPIAERLFFNYEGIDFDQIEEPIVHTLNDSLLLKIPISEVNEELLQNISISVLPSRTKSYSHHHNIISSTLLQPYIKSDIEKGEYYFTEITERKKYELDQLLLTQGWSSYDWDIVFKNPPNNYYPIEKGIQYRLRVNNSDTKNVFVYPNLNTNSELVTLKKDEVFFARENFFPIQGEKLRVGGINKKGEIGALNASVQFSPSRFLDFPISYEPISIFKSSQLNSDNISRSDGENFNEIVQLDEIIIDKGEELTREEKLNRQSFGNVYVLSERDRNAFATLGQYLSRRGFIVNEASGGFDIRSQSGARSGTPVFILNGIRLGDLSVLSNFNLDIVDYIEINRFGIGEGITAAGVSGVIKIVTDPLASSVRRNEEPNYTEHDIPLSFSAPKRFYTPQYNSFKSNFFNEFGVVDWFPNKKVNQDGYVEIKILNTKNPIQLFIEGVINNNVLLSKKKIIELD